MFINGSDGPTAGDWLVAALDGAPLNNQYVAALDGAPLARAAEVGGSARSARFAWTIVAAKQNVACSYVKTFFLKRWDGQQL